MFETFIIQPIFNLLLFIYSILPGNDFGIAVILFTLIIRFAMWPLLKKQLHTTKVMREMQPEIKKVKKKAKGDRQLEGKLMMELYKEKGVSPFSSIGLLMVQLPVFIGLFSALRSLESPTRLVSLPYEFVRNMQPVQDILSTVTEKTNAAITAVKLGEANSETINKLSEYGIGVNEPVTTQQLESLSPEQLEFLYNDVLVNNIDGAAETLVSGPFFDQFLFGIIDLSRAAIQVGLSLYVPLLIIAILAGVFQYLQTKQISANNPSSSKGAKSIRDILRDSKNGKEPDQSDINSAVGSRMSLFFAPLIAYISAISLGGLSVYFLTSGVIGYLQQKYVLNKDVEEMESIADEKSLPSQKAKSKASNKNTKKTSDKTKNKKNTSKSSSAKRNKKKR